VITVLKVPEETGDVLEALNETMFRGYAR